MANEVTQAAPGTVIPSAPKKEALTNSERFTDKVMKEFSSNVAGALQVTDYQKSLIQGYFIVTDRALKTAEEERQRKNSTNSDHKYDNDLPIVWQNVNLDDLALDAVHYARIGLDMMQENHLFPIPYKNNKTKKYDVTLMPGYNGKKYVAEKYAANPPKNVTYEVVYTNDKFKAIKKSGNNLIESYEFEIVDAFDRGEIKGGFAYIEYADPSQNKLITMSMKDIEKRKPKYASAEFWGGTKKVKVDGQWVEQQIEGWKDEMVYKTIIREVYGGKHIPIDPKKIDDNYHYMLMREARYADVALQAEINENANTVVLDAPAPNILPEKSATVDTDTGEVKEAPTPAADDLP